MVFAIILKYVSVPEPKPEEVLATSRKKEILCVVRAAREYQRNIFKFSFAFSRLKFLYIICELMQLERWKMRIICSQGSGAGKKKAYLHKLTSVNSFSWFYQGCV